jgi:ankyrin repeat protein
MCQTTDWPLHKRRHDDLKSGIDDDNRAHEGEARDGNGMTELMSKAAVGDWRAVKKMLAAGRDPNLSDSQGFTALNHAAFHGHIEVVSTLLASLWRHWFVPVFGISEWASEGREGAGQGRW